MRYQILFLIFTLLSSFSLGQTNNSLKENQNIFITQDLEKKIFLQADFQLPHSLKSDILATTMLWFKEFHHQLPPQTILIHHISKKTHFFTFESYIVFENQIIQKSSSNMESYKDFAITLHHNLKEMFSNSSSDIQTEKEKVEIMFLSDSIGNENTVFQFFSQNPFELFNFLPAMSQKGTIQMGYMNFQDHANKINQIFLPPSQDFSSFVDSLSKTGQYPVLEDSTLDFGLRLLKKEMRWHSKQRYLLILTNRPFLKEQKVLQELVQLQDQNVHVVFLLMNYLGSAYANHMAKLASQFNFKFTFIEYELIYADLNHHLSQYTLKQGTLRSYNEITKNTVLIHPFEIQTVDDVNKIVHKVLNPKLKLQNIKLKIPENKIQLFDIQHQDFKTGVFIGDSNVKFRIQIPIGTIDTILDKKKGQVITLGGILIPQDNVLAFNSQSIRIVDQEFIPKFFIQPGYKLLGLTSYFTSFGFYEKGLWFTKGKFIDWET